LKNEFVEPFDDGTPVNEALVLEWMDRAKKEGSMPWPWVIKSKDGQLVTFDEDCRAKVEAARRLGWNEIGIHQIEEEEADPAKLASFREWLNQVRGESQ
jgi:hypothetical protein